MASKSPQLLQFLQFLFVCSWLVTTPSSCTSPPIRAVNLGGWLVIERWITPELFNGPEDYNSALVDGTHVTFWSVTQKMFLSAANGGGSTVAANENNAQDWETFRLWKMKNPNSMFKIRVFKNQFVSVNDQGEFVAVETTPDQGGVFQIIRNEGNSNQTRIKAPNGNFLQVNSDGSVTANGEPSESWSNSDPTVFAINITLQMGGDAQLCSFHGADKTVSILQDHWNRFIVEDDFSFISSSRLNAVRIPVAWWITMENGPISCHPPRYLGYQAVLDKAFDWADKYNLGVIVDLHAAPWSQNGESHSASRDGTVGWGSTDANIQQTVQVIEALAARYASRKSLLAIELLNEPSSQVQFGTLEKYYKAAYAAVRRQVQRDDVYVIMSSRFVKDDDTKLIDFASGFKNCVVDVHYYNFGSKFDGMSPQQNIDYVKGVRAGHLASLMRANGALVFVGEWTAEWGRHGASDEDYRRFAKAQMDVYGQATFGWAYWTYRNDQNRNWSLKDMIKNNIISVPQN